VWHLSALRSIPTRLMLTLVFVITAEAAGQGDEKASI
jgi:hypothetical protein